MSKGKGLDTEFGREDRDRMDVDEEKDGFRQIRNDGSSHTRTGVREPHIPTRTEPKRGATFDREAIANLIAEQLQQAMIPLLTRVNALSNTIAALPVPQPATSVQLPDATAPPLPPPVLGSRKRRKFPTWSGERRHFNCYIKEVEDCIEIDRDLMGSNRAVWYDINFSLPDVAKQKVSVFNGSGQKLNWDYQLFIDHLKRTFGNRQEREDKIELLSKMKQRENQRFSEFFPKFDEALAGAGGETWTEDSKVIWLRKALSDALTTQLIPVPIDLNDYHGAVRTIEDTAYRFEHSSLFKGSRANSQAPGNLVPETNVAPVVRFDSDGDVIMNPINSNQKSPQSLRDQHRECEGQRRARWVDSAEITRRRKLKLCVRCGANTHFIARCPYLPPRYPKTEIKTTATNTPQLEGEVEIIGPELDQEKE
ncbi:hypothetical protein K3495_g12856 [Podosphaera aphanis]|nr:hypothetical protein K3495_g12856 [Podosphaera aphanis]